MSRKKKGMSLIEVVMAMAIFVIIATAISTTILSTMKISSRNRTKFQSNANSKTFIELVKSDAYRPNTPKAAVPGPPPVARKGILPGWYYESFKDDSELSAMVNTLETRAIGDAVGVVPTFESAKLKAPPSATDKYIMAIKVVWNTTDNIYEMDVKSWDLKKGESSSIDRRILIAPK